MIQNKKIEIGVGFFMLTSIIAIIFLCINVINFGSFFIQSSWKIYANFNNIGNLRINAPVKIGGVIIGKVIKISLSEKLLLPCVTIAINNKYTNKIPNNSSLEIKTQGLLGDQFIALNLGFYDPLINSNKMLKNGDILYNNKSSLVLEDIIGQFIYK